jgi:transcriptional regulator with XRE-family HTH domain
MKKVDPAVLKRLRAAKGWSQERLAEKTKFPGVPKIDKQTISRLERGEQMKTRGRTTQQLARALDVEPAVLIGDAPIPAPHSNPEPVTPKHRLNLAICTEARNALHLAAERYNISQRQIVELAPLLFCWAAEASLRQRRDNIMQVERACETVQKLEQGLPHLPVPDFPYAEVIAAERESIDRCDLFAIGIQNGDTILEGTFSRFSDMDNPFAMFLGSLAQEMGNVATFLECSWDELPLYRVCPDEAAYLVGGDKARADDILNGYVSLSEMPKEIRDSMMFKERADWVRTKADEYCKEVFGTINRPRRFSASSFAEEESDGALT